MILTKIYNEYELYEKLVISSYVKWNKKRTTELGCSSCGSLM